MFNEAFWFFYLIGVAGNMANVIFATAIICGFAGAFALFFGAMETSDKAGKIGVRLAITCVICLIVSGIIPSQQSLYAGGAQYAVQAVELDDTIMAFKEIIDAKIADLTPTGETE